MKPTQAIFMSCALAIAAIAFSCDSVAGPTTYYYTDTEGSPLVLADAQGTILQSIDYKPFGNQADGTPGQGVSFTGHIADADLNLVYMQARYYDPVVGRFLSGDPKPPSPGDLFLFNRFSYASNNPYRLVDPDGRTQTEAQAIADAKMLNESGNGSLYVVRPPSYPGGGYSVQMGGAWANEQLFSTSQAEQEFGAHTGPQCHVTCGIFLVPITFVFGDTTPQNKETDEKLRNTAENLKKATEVLKEIPKADVQAFAQGLSSLTGAIKIGSTEIAPLKIVIMVPEMVNNEKRCERRCGEDDIKRENDDAAGK